MFRILKRMSFSEKSVLPLRLMVASSLLGLALPLRAQEGPQTPPPQTPPSTPASSSQNPVTNPQPVPSPDAAAKATVRRFIYSCDGGVKLTVGYSESAAKVTYNGHVYLMKQVMSADGGRYSDGKLVWWSKGNGGFLAETDDDSPTGGKQLATNCAGTPAPAANVASGESVTSATVSSGLVTGTVSYLYRIAMPPNAVAVVQLQDVSHADTAAPIIAEQKITFGDRQVPLPFELKFDPSTIDPKHRYAVRVTIVVDGVVRFHTDHAYPVITRGHPSKLDLVLKQSVDPGPAKP
jgi:putative lipoprotein